MTSTTQPTRPKLWPYLIALVLAVGVAIGITRPIGVDGEPASFPFPNPIYEIEATSGAHHASLLNLPLPYVGAPQVPIPVDVNGDLLPDVTMAVNLIDPEGLFHNPPQPADIPAPNVEVRRLLTAPILGQTNPPLRINAKLTLVDLQGEQGPMEIRFGYDTGLGGSIPTDFKAVITGLADFFNPLVATVDTTGGLLGIDPGLPDLGLGPVAPSYSGPLTIIGGIQSDAIDADLGLAFDPLPNRLQVTYGTEGDHQVVTYAHGSEREVDVTTDVNLESADGSTTDVLARVDRLPRQMAVDIAMADGGGSIDYDAAGDGRLPDIAVDLARHAPGPEPDTETAMNGRFEIEALPDEVSADWTIAPGEGGTDVDFESSGAGIGAIEARIATYDGTSPVIEPWIPTEEQYFNLATGPDGFDGDLLIEARLERIRSASFSAPDAGGMSGTVDVGDGEQALAAHVDADLRTAETPGPRIDLTTTIAPLPDHIGFSYQPATEGDSPTPLVATYESSETVDVDANAEVALPGTPADVDCGAVLTICGDLSLRNLPTELTATVTNDDDAGTTQILLDTTPAEGAALPDVRADLVLGALGEDPDPDARAMYIHGELLGLPQAATVDLIEDPVDQALQEIRFLAADDGNIGEVRFQVANFDEDERPDDLLPPQAIAPTWASITARGLDDPDDGMLFEAAGRLTDVREVRYLDVDDVLAVHARAGQGEDFAATVDMQGIDRPGDDPDLGRVDTQADALLQPLPQDVQFCFGGAGRDLVAEGEASNELTEGCQPSNPYDDGSLETTPLVMDYQGDVEFDVRGSFATTSHGNAALILDDRTMSADFDVRGVPTALNAQITMPTEAEPGPMRVLTDAADTIDSVDVGFAMTTALATCDDPNPGVGEALCADASATDLPRWASVVSDTSIEDELHLGFHACDWDVAADADDDDDTEAGCRRGDEDDEIGSVDAQVHVNRGTPDPAPIHERPAGQHAMVLADMEGESGLALDASVAVDHIRALEVDTTPTGIEASTNLGDGVAPLALYGDIDLRHDDAPDALRIVADAEIDPLPQILTLVQTVTPDDDDPNRLLDVDVTTSEPSTLTADLKAFPADTDADGDRCADTGTLCADLTVERIPETLGATFEVSEEELGGDGDPRLRHTNIDIVATPHDGQDKPDITANATLGEGALGLPFPSLLIAELGLEGVPGTLSVDLLERERTVPPPVGEWNPDSFGSPTLARSLERIDVVADDHLDALTANARTFVLPPPDLPPLSSVTEDNYAIVNGLGSNFQGAVRFTDVQQVHFLNRQVDGDDDTSGRLVGFNAQVGGGGSFRAAADVTGLRLGSMGLLGADFDDAVLDAEASVVLSNLPSNIGFCLRDGGITPLPDPVGGDLTANCEDDDPFAGFDTGFAPADEPDLSLERTPLSVSFDTNATIADLDVIAEVTLAEDSDPDEALHLDGELHVTDLPDEITAHVLMPDPDDEEQDGDPIVLRASLPQEPGTGFTVTAAAELRHGDAVCEDPRSTAVVSCFGATLSDVPERVDVYLDPDRAEHNLSVRAVGDSLLDITDVRVDLQDGTGDVKVIEADLIDLPSLVTGTLRLPGDSGDKPGLSVVAEPPLGSATVAFRNYIAPDPFGPDAVPSVRDEVPAADQYVHLLQRDGATRVEAHLESIASAGFRMLRDGLGAPLDTLVVNAGFGTPSSIRAYADLQTPDDGTDNGLSGTRLIADATLTDVPDEVELCFRPARPDGAGSSPESNWCEDEVVPGAGGVELVSSATTDPEALLDAYAFFRLADAGGDPILAASASLIDVAPVIRATIPTGGGSGAGVLDIGGYEADAVTPAPVATVDAEVATFDLPDDGYDEAERPYSPRRIEADPFPAVVDDDDAQHLSAVLVDGDVHIDARLGPESPLQRVQLQPGPCALGEGNTPPDYPYFPDDGTDYQCVRLDLADAAGPGDPLALHVVREQDEQRLALTDAGITDLPSWIAVTLATGAETTYDSPDVEGNEQSLRRPCGSAADEDGGAEGDCVAPMVRFDQPADAVLYGTFTYGDRDALPRLADLAPQEDGVVPDLVVSPGADGSGWSGDPGWGDARGVRATVGKVHQIADGGDGPLSTVVRANLRLDVPRSLTIDQFQQWEGEFDGEVILPHTVNTSSDLRFRFVVRDAGGAVVPELGRVAALLQLAPEKQLLLGGAGESTLEGFPLPGEIGVGVYTRSAVTTDQLGNGTAHDFVQINGRVSVDIDLGVRMFSGGDLAVGARADLYHVPGTDHMGPNEAPDAPSFVVAIERDREYSKPSAPAEDEEPPPDPCTPTKCTEVGGNVDISAVFDLAPTADEPQTRRLDLYLRTRGVKNSMQLNAYADPAGTIDSVVSGAATLTIEELTLHFHRGVYLVGSFTLDLTARATVPIIIDRVSDLELRHNLLGIRLESEGSFGGGVQVVDTPMDFLEFLDFFPGTSMNIDHLSVQTWAIGIPVLMANFVPPGGALNLDFINCTAFGAPWEGITHENSTNSAWVLWPFDDPGIQVWGVGAPIAAPLLAIFKKIGPLFCFANAVPIPNDVPEPDYVAEGHPVPFTSGVSAGPPEDVPEDEPTGSGPPDHTVAAGDTLSLCGTHEFGTLTVNGTLRVDADGEGSATVADDFGDRPDCVADDGGVLTLMADHVIVGPDGRIEAVAGLTGTGGGNGGAGHGGVGGNGSDGDGGPASVDLDPAYEPEPGTRGGNNGGAGGGALAIHTRLLDVEPDNDDDPGETQPGTITVAGRAGSAFGPCTDAEGTTPATGGGSGGTLVLSASRVDNDGVITADGGRGGYGTLGGGGGGGGGAGVLEIRVPFWTGDQPTADGGSGGTNLCAPDQDDPAPSGEPGEAYVFEIDDSAWSTPMAPVDFWQRPRGLVVPVSAAVPAAQAPNGYQVVLCAVQLAGEDVDPDADPALVDQLAAIMPSPDAIDADHPCGSGTVIGSRSGVTEEVGYAPPDEVTNFDLGFDNIDAVNGLSSGITGLWSSVVALPPGIDDCTVADPDDGCTPLQPLPPQPQVVLGIDEDRPDVDLNLPNDGFESGTGAIQLHFDVEGDAAFPFGTPIESIRCRNEDGPAVACADGDIWHLSDGAGAKTVHVEAVDGAGNVGHASVTGTAVTELPWIEGTISDPPPGSDWYTSAPTINLAILFVEAEDMADPPIRYSIDGGPERACQTIVCEVPSDELEALGPGLHRIGWTAVDRYGRRLARSAYMGDEDGQWLEFRTDYEAPTGQLDLVPGAPDGEDGWYVSDPWVVVSAVDQDQASGLDQVLVSVDGDADVTYDGPFQLGNGSHDVCWHAVDHAGNASASECVEVRVDLSAATADGAVDGSFPAIPDGQSGWFVTVPSTTVSGWSDGSGSGLPTDGLPIRFRVDNGGWLSCDQPCDLPSLLYHGTGRHRVLWSTLDESGRRSQELPLRFDIDLTPPAASVVVGPMAPVGLNGWHVGRPWVRLAAEDPGAIDGQASGVDAMTYTVDGGPVLPYGGPFLAPEGDHEICGRAVDQAGNTGPEDCIDVRVDAADPSASIGEAPGVDGDAGWHVTATDASASGVDAVGGSGVDPAPLTDPCGWVPGVAVGPSGTCMSVDGGPFFLASEGPVTLDEGVHRVRAFSLDRSGRRSVVVSQSVLVDRSAPVTSARMFSPAPATDGDGWYRSPVTVALVAGDGDRNSGVVTTRYRIDAGPWLDYTRPFVVGEGMHTVRYRSTDASGLEEVERVLPLSVDLTPTTVTALVPSPTVWIQLLGLLGPPNAQLRWRVTENLADHVRVQVVIYDTLGNVVRRLDGGSHVVTPGVPLEGFTLWDGKDKTLLGIVPVGIYHYRVVVTDEAGNTSQSGESRPIQLKVQVCLPIVGCL